VGACCRAGWQIPIEPALQRELDAARASGRLQVLPRSDSCGECEFYEAPDHRSGAPGRCAIHRQLGVALKPASCRHFPRVALLDPRGVSITLSHYCPTAASMLFRTDVPLAITGAPPAFARDDEYEGLDARDVLPPLLRPGMLWDFDGYNAWEHHAVALLARDGTTPEHALDTLARAATQIEGWRPSLGRLADHVGRVFSGLTGEAAPALTRHRKTSDSSAVINRYLAARLFASWVPYQADRLSALVDDLARAHRILREEAARAGATLLEAIRATDLRVVHGRSLSGIGSVSNSGASTRKAAEDTEKEN
jgi:hypothetical protein